MQLFSTLTEYTPHLELIGKIGGAAAVIWGAKKYIISPIVVKLAHWKKWCLSLGKAIDSVEKIRGQVYSNGGNSLRDRIDAIDSRLTFMESRENIMLDDNPAAIFICDVEGQNSYTNRTFCRLLNCSREELQGHGWKNFIVEEKLEAYEDLWKPAFQYNRQINADVLFRTTDGVTKCCHVSIFCLNRPEDKLRRFMGKVQANKECATCLRAGKPCAMNYTLSAMH